MGITSLVLTIILPGNDYYYPNFIVLTSLSCLLRVTELVRQNQDWNPSLSDSPFLTPSSLFQNESIGLDSL